MGKIYPLLFSFAAFWAGSVRADSVTIEFDADRPGSDIQNFDLNSNGTALDCLNVCRSNSSCRAYTYVKAGVQGTLPRCWLKSRVPAAGYNACCISGFRY